MQSLSPQITSLSHGPLSQLRGIEPSLLYNHFKQQAQQASGSARHSLRQVILGQKLMQQTNYMSLSLQVRHFHIDYSFQQPYQAVFLASCPVYHPWHISHVANTISLLGELVCPTCKTVCPNLAAVLTDALILSVFRWAQHNSDTKLIFRHRKCEVEELSLLLLQAETKETTTVVEQEGEKWMVETQIWQFSKDENIEKVSIEELTQQISRAKGKESQQYERDLEAKVVPLLVNLICLESGVRIRNPLIHRQCRHEGKLLLFSFQQIYLSIFSDKDNRISCPLEGCSHFFSRSNFQEVGLVLPSLQNSIYSENNSNMFGMIFGGTYIQNWHLSLAQQRLQLGALGGFMPQIQSRMNELLTTASLREGASRAAKIQRKMQTEKGQAALSSQEKWKGTDTYVRVELGPSTMCPVRCYKCIGLNAGEAFELSLRFSKGMSQCPLCGHQLKKKQFYDCFYLDVKLYQFIFLQGHARKLVFHPSSSSYCHQLNHYTGDSLRKYLRQSGRINNGPHKLPPNKLNLRSKRSSLATIHQSCFQEGGDQRILDHVVFVPDNQPIDDGLQCRCGRILGANSLLYLPFLQQLIAAQCNGLTKTDCPGLSPMALISSLEHYRKIKEFSQLPERDLTLYWCNKQGQIIKQPFLFIGCSHMLETAICDFADIREQAKGGATIFTCRLKECKNQYRSVCEMRRLNIPIFEMLQEQPSIKREVVRSGNYWITYHQGTRITITPRNDHLARIEKEYRRGREEGEGVGSYGTRRRGGRERLRASGFNTAVLERCYPSQLKDAEIPSLPDPLPLPANSSQGNLLLFRYPVPWLEGRRSQMIGG